MASVVETGAYFTLINFPNVLILLIVTLFSYVIYTWLKYSNAPPCYGNLVPYIGCAIQFGKSPLHFIETIRKKLGPVFTLKVAGKRLTFVTEPEDFKYFFNSDKLDFQQAVREPVKNTAFIPEDVFQKHHTKVHDTMKWRLSQTKLLPFCKSLNEGFSREMDAWGESGSAELNCMIRSCMYKVILNNLFGHQVLPTADQDEFALLEKHFVKFDEDFEYGSQLPPLFLKEWNMSRNWLLKLFRKVVANIDMKKPPSEEETLLETLVKTINDPHGANFSMLMMWASLANAIPITFWTLALMIADQEVLMKAKAEIYKILGNKGSNLELTQDDLAEMPYIRSCMLEAIRLRSPGVITRGVTEPIQIRGYTVPAGDMMMLSPYWAHRNPAFFPDPEHFNPDRWQVADENKAQFLEGFVAFGGGRYQCPGRWFALLEIHLFLVLVLYKFDFQLKDKIPEASSLHVVGTQQPAGPCDVTYHKVVHK